MSNEYFSNVSQIGRMYLEYVFYEFEKEPILFTCIDEKKNLYLCLCSEIRYGQRWIATKCSVDVLEALIEEKMDIASAFLTASRATRIEMDLQGSEKSETIDIKEIDRLDLPKEGTFIRCDKNQAKDYLQRKRLDSLSVSLKAMIDSAISLGRSPKTYRAVFNKTVKQVETSSTFESKHFIEQRVVTGEQLNDVITVKCEYRTYTESRYVQQTDNSDCVDKLDDNNYIQAA